MIATTAKPCATCRQRQRLPGQSYCRQCRAAYYRQYRQITKTRQRKQQAAQPTRATEPTHYRVEYRLQAVAARIERDEARLHAAGLNPDKVAAERADQVLIEAVGQARPMPDDEPPRK